LETLSPPPSSAIGHSHSELQLLDEEVLLLLGGSSRGDFGVSGSGVVGAVVVLLLEGGAL